MSLGGRGIDTAWSYFNQPAVGAAVREQHSAPRKDVFLTTKIECMGTADAAYAAIERDLKLLGLEYVDLVLIHAPYKGFGEPYSNCSRGPAGARARQDTWRGMERAVRDGLTRAIGLSNFNGSAVDELMRAGVAVKPAINQCGFSIGGHAASMSAWGRDDPTVAKCREENITYSAYSPLGGWTKVPLDRALGPRRDPRPDRRPDPESPRPATARHGPPRPHPSAGRRPQRPHGALDRQSARRQRGAGGAALDGAAGRGGRLVERQAVAPRG